MSAKAIRIRGIVQGVGFRPMIWRLARLHQLTGAVWNDGRGVMIHVQGDAVAIDCFVKQIPLQLPPLARLDSLEVEPLSIPVPGDEFRIIASQIETAETAITADAATCPACLDEIFDPNNRRFQYPFTNCTHCGPRLSIVRRVPYDRCHTSMAEFPMCTQCQQEYDDPGDRRFHAQANCCVDCGPTIWLESATQLVSSETASVIELASHLIQQGAIIAIKGLGGFHLACNALDEKAVSKLRERKRRYAKPFALMARDLDIIQHYAVLTGLEKQALSDKAAPIVLLKAFGQSVATGVAPGDDKLGFMLPYTPLHSLLMQTLEQPIVLTSGNISDEPQCIDNDDAKLKLAGIADYWLFHDRVIVNRLDDSVVRQMEGQIRVLRRARGYCPTSSVLPSGFDQNRQLLAMGAELKNSFCLIKNGQALVSQHLGDLENAVVQRDYRAAIALYQQLYDFQADAIVIDQHPGYLSSQYGQSLAETQAVPVQAIQHHHAHLAACLLEHGVSLDEQPVLAVIYDGLGWGAGELWGGEFFLGNYHHCKRLAHFQTIPMPGASQAIREPWRNAYAQLSHYFDWATIARDYAELALIKRLSNKPLGLLASMMAKGLNSPGSSSCGRWFDAFAAALDLHSEHIDYEGQAAIAMEILATSVYAEEQVYADVFSTRVDDCLVIEWSGLWRSVLTDLNRGTETARIAARIHHSLAESTVSLLSLLSHQHQVDRVVLSGGVFQNRLLLESVAKKLSIMGKQVLLPQNYPANDGGVALGQAVIALAAYSETGSKTNSLV